MVFTLDNHEKMLNLLEDYFNDLPEPNTFDEDYEVELTKIDIEELTKKLKQSSSSLYSKILGEIEFSTLQKRSEFIGFLKGYFYCLEKRQSSKY